jgi:hypothetical protein
MGTYSAKTLVVTGSNVGVGIINPSFPFTVRNSSNATVNIGGGNSNTVPAISIQSDTGSWASSGNGFAFYYNASDGDLDLYRKNNSITENQVMTWERATGNVGIGTASPGSLLQVGGSGATATATPTAIQLDNSYRNGVGGNTSLKFYLYKNGTETYGIGLNNAGGTEFHAGVNGGAAGAYYAFYQEGSEKVRIGAGGNVGIGITTPGAQLVVGTQSSGTAGTGFAQDNSIIARFGARNDGLRVVGATITNTAPATVANDATLSFIVAGTYSSTGLISTILQSTSTAVSDMAFSVYDGSSNPERMRISGVAGNVGIGNTNPGRKLDVLEGNVQIVANFQNTNTTSSRIKFTDANTGAENVNIGATGTKLAMWTNNTVRMTIISGGNVGIGTTNPTHLLHVNGTLRVDNAGSAPSANNGNAISRYYGTDESYYLSEPNAWLAINVAGTPYVIPLYS